MALKNDIAGDFPVKFVGHWTLLQGYTSRTRRGGQQASAADVKTGKTRGVL
jgi:hypothetical protein